MSGTLTPRYSKEEFARRGDEIYERNILPRLTKEDEDKFVLIDIESGDYELDRDEMAASDRLFARRPDAQVWFRRVGTRPVRRFGPRYRGRILVTMSGGTTIEVEELARRGDEIYERDVIPRIGPGERNQVVAIDVETGDYEIAGDELAAAHRLRARRPEAQIWFRRVGSRYLHRFGHGTAA